MKILSAVMILIFVFLIGAKVGKETTPNYHNAEVPAPSKEPTKQLTAMDVISKRTFTEVVEFCYDGVKYIKMGDSISVKLKHSDISNTTPMVDYCKETK